MLYLCARHLQVGPKNRKLQLSWLCVFSDASRHGDAIFVGGVRPFSLFVKGTHLSRPPLARALAGAFSKTCQPRPVFLSDLTESHPAVHESLPASAALAKPPQENQVKIEVKVCHAYCVASATAVDSYSLDMLTIDKLSDDVLLCIYLTHIDQKMRG
jgi:hypothetical protein